MRVLIALVLFSGFVFASCKKYQLKQPAHLSLKWDFFNEDPAETKIHVTGGYFYLDNLKVHGTREEGPAVEIEQTMPTEKVLFSNSGSLGLSIDIPAGKYTDFAIDLSVINETSPSMVLNGLVNRTGTLVPLRIEWSVKQALSFLPPGVFELKKKEDYAATLGVDVSELLLGIAPQKWEDAVVSLENGTPTIVVKETSNHVLFGQIDQNLKTALKLKIE